MTRLAISDICLTPWEPRGRVRIVEIEASSQPYGQTVIVEFLHDHRGYAKGSHGRYMISELTRTLPESSACTN